MTLPRKLTTLFLLFAVILSTAACDSWERRKKGQSSGAGSGGAGLPNLNGVWVTGCEGMGTAFTFSMLVIDNSTFTLSTLTFTTSDVCNAARADRNLVSGGSEVSYSLSNMVAAGPADNTGTYYNVILTPWDPPKTPDSRVLHHRVNNTIRIFDKTFRQR